VEEFERMHCNVFLKSLLVMPAALSVVLFPGSPLLAAEDVNESSLLIEQSAPTANAVVDSLPSSPVTLAVEPAASSDPSAPLAPLTSTPDPVSLEQIDRYTTGTVSGGPISQVTSVSELSDVSPDDWAFEALSFLANSEAEGGLDCLEGYPDGTFKGSRAMTRYEFAAGLASCLDALTGRLSSLDPDALARIEALQQEFAAELATLKGRVDALEAAVTDLQENQFSTTTRLVGRTQFLVSGVIDEDDDLDTNPFEDDNDDDNNGEGIDPDSQIFFGYRVRLNFDTSFNGTDLLRARLQARNISEFDSDPIGFQASGNSGNNVQIDDLYYRFKVGDRLGFWLGAEGVDVDDLVPAVTYPLGASSDSGAISEFADPRQYETGFAGSGAAFGVSYDLVDRDNFGINLSGGYVADNPGNPDSKNGLFNGDYSAIGQLTFTSDLVDVALTYVNAYSVAADFDADLYSVAGPQIANTYGVQFNFKLFDDSVQIGGGGALVDVSGIGSGADYDVWSYQGTLAFPDLGGEGNLLGILGGVLPYTRELDGQTTDTAFLGEVFYRYLLSDNIAVTPSLIYIADPFNDNDNSDTFIGTVRMTFSF